jgi:phenylalanyl-tRNA synthetase alpha chain
VKIGSQKALQLKWLKAEGKTALVRVAESIEDTDKVLLEAFVAKPDLAAHSTSDVDKLKKRKLINIATQKTYSVAKGSNFAPVRQKMETDLSADMIKSGAWKDKRFKNFNFNA